MADNHDSLITQFKSTTGASEDHAKLYLESSAWRLDIAIDSYYENEAGSTAADDTGPSTTTSAGVAATGEVTTSPHISTTRNRQTNSNVATLASLLNNSSSDEDTDNEEGQAFYAGGSEHSGQQVLGPPKKKNKDFVEQMFKTIKQNAVEVLDATSGHHPSSSRQSQGNFSGAGYRLGQSADEPMERVGASTSSQQQQNAVHVVLKLWRDGYSVDDGELCSFTDPENSEFLRSIQHGEIPQQLRRGTSEVHLVVEDHRGEAFTRRATKMKAFSGQGHTLGRPTPTLVPETAPSNCSEQDRVANETRARELVNVDSSLATTSLQIRLADGSRLMAQFNNVHTVSQLRQYIRSARPEYQQRNFNLLTAYPSKCLQDDSQTLQEAGLLNSVIVQKLI